MNLGYGALSEHPLSSPGNVLDDDGDSGWLHLRFARAALAVSLSLAVPVFANQGDDLAFGAAPSAPADEAYWANPVAPVPASLVWPQQWTFNSQDDPAGSLRGQPDEDFWRNPAAPVPASLARPQPWSFDIQDPAGFLRGVPEEDSFQRLPAPVQGSLRWPQPWLGDLQDPAGNLRGVPEEDSFQRLPAPVPASLVWPQQWPFDLQDPAGSLYIIPQDEAGLLSPPPPPLPRVVPFSTDDELVPQPAVTAPPDADFWASGVAPGVAALAWPQPAAFDEQIPGNLRGQPDEDFWVSRVAPVPATLSWPQQWIFDIQDPAGLRGQLDEDFWRSSVTPVTASLLWPQPSSFDIQDPAGSLRGVAEEETGPLWIAPPPLPAPVIPFTATDDIVPQPAGTAPPEEEAGLLRPILPPLAWPQPWLRDEQEPGALRGQPDEDFWRSGVVPLSGALLWPQPWSFEAAEVVLAVVAITPDEDFWVSGPAPVVGALRTLHPWGFESQEHPQLWFVRGITRDSAGTPLPTCAVHLFRTSDDVEVGQTISDAVGYFEFVFTSDPAIMFYLVCYKAGAPDVAGTSVNTLVATN